VRLPLAKTAGRNSNPDKIQSLFKEAGYIGEPLVLIDPTDQSNLQMLAQVLREHVEKVGLNVDLQAMNWSTLVPRRAIKTPPGRLLDPNLLKGPIRVEYYGHRSKLRRRFQDIGRHIIFTCYCRH